MTPSRKTNNLIKKWAKNLNRHFSEEVIQRVQRHMKECSASLAIREMQSETKVTYHFTPVRMAITNKSTNNKCCRGCGEKGTLVHCWWECRLVRPLWKTVRDFLRKLKMELHPDAAIPLLGLYPKNPETPIQKNLCTLMFLWKLLKVLPQKQVKSIDLDTGVVWPKMYLRYSIFSRNLLSEWDNEANVSERIAKVSAILC